MTHAHAQFTAAESMHRALSNTPCICIFEAPYAPRGKLLKQCARCKAIAAWEVVSKVETKQENA